MYRLILFNYAPDHSSIVLITRPSFPRLDYFAPDALGIKFTFLNAKGYVETTR